MLEKSLFEVAMLLCFGVAWPVSIFKSWTSRRNKGKSLGFLIVVFLGYVFGILNKVFNGVDYVLYFYILNLVMVFLDILIFFRNMYYEKRMASSIDGGVVHPRRSPYSK